MPEDYQIPIILGRPFLNTTGAVIDVKNGKLTFEVGDDRVTFSKTPAIKNSMLIESCCMLDSIDASLEEGSDEFSYIGEDGSKKITNAKSPWPNLTWELPKIIRALMKVMGMNGIEFIRI